ncbi:MAG TPA: DUF2079 domain-containing protein [Acidimicrobiales bacterium]
MEAARPAPSGPRAGSLRPVSRGEPVAESRRWVALLVHLPMAALVAAYALRFSLLSVNVHNGYGTPAFDMAIPDQAIWLMSRFHAPFSTVMGRNFFGDHTSFILALLVPLFWVYPHTAALLVVQSMLLAAAAIPIYLYARHRLGSTVLATLLAASFLLNPALQNGNLEQFHVECFTVLLLSVALFAALENKGWLLGLSIVGLLLCKEDAALLVVPLGVWVAWRQNRAWGIRIIVLALGWTLFASEVVIKSLVGVVNVHNGRIPFGGAGGALRTLVRRPGTFANYVSSDGRLFYVWQMVFSAGLVLLAAPEVAAIAILTLATNVLASFNYEHQILFHYSMPLVPILTFGTVFAVGALRTTKSRQVATGAVAVCSLWACVLWGLAPFSVHQYPHLSPSSPEVANINRVLKSLPADAVVTAYYPYVSHIDHRTRIYMWPNPFRAQYWDRFQQEGQRLPFADQIRWLVLPTGLTGTDASLLASIAPSYHLVQQDGDVALYQHN